MRRVAAVLGSYVGVLSFAGLVFLGAGRLDLPTAWLYLALALVGTTVSHLLTPRGSDLPVDRLTRAADGPPWDKALLAVSLGCSLVMFVLAGLDVGRFGWTGPLPLLVPAVGAALMVAGQLAFAPAKRENRWFSSTVRLQPERGHAVCDTGPYRLVRHPGYLGLLVSQFAFPLVLGSGIAMLPAFVLCGATFFRAEWEDEFLRKKLPGYAAYAARTPWLLFPGLR